MTSTRCLEFNDMEYLVKNTSKYVMERLSNGMWYIISFLYEHVYASTYIKRQHHFRWN